MQYRPLGRTGTRVSAVSLGGAYLAGDDPDRARENARTVVQRAFDLGINYIDTAPLYGNSEALLGHALEGEPRPFYLSTKVGFDPEDFDYRRDSVLWSLERSLKRLGLPRLYGAQIHEVNMAGWERITEKGGALEGLRAAQKQGLCEIIGITGRAIPLLSRLASTGEFDTVLFYHDYHPCSQQAAAELLPAAAAQNMGVIAATVLAGGLYVDGPKQEQALENIRADKGEQGRQKALEVLERLRSENGTLPQNAFRYVLGDARISTVSSGAASPAQLEEVAQAPEMGPLNHLSPLPKSG